MINTDLLRSADEHNVTDFLVECSKYLESKLSFENALDVLVSTELTNQKALLESASNKTGAYNEIYVQNFRCGITFEFSILKAQY